MRHHELPLKGGDEYDALTHCKRDYIWRSRTRKKIKQGYNKRVRKMARLELRTKEDK